MNLPGGDTGFTFIRPLWLIGLLLLPGIGWAWRRIRGSSGWESHIDATKLAYLEIATPAERSSMRGLVIGCLALALIALAGPSWRTIPLPVKQTRDAMVIAFDLSPSMLATDLSPDRLTRARLKIIDLLRRRQEGETALIAYADDAYRVSPLTDDTATIEALVPSLHPNVMPGPGSQVEAAVAMARELLTGASIEKGVVLIVTDGIETDAMRDLERELGDSLQLCVLGVGTTEGVPIPLPGGGFARDAENQTILASLNRQEISSLTRRHGGCFAELRSDDADLDAILSRIGAAVGDDLEESESTFDVRHDEGYWLVVLLLPAAALAFRRNVFWIVLLISPGVSLFPSSAQAIEWGDLWQRADQQAARALEDGVEAYRRGDYEGAAESFEGETSLHRYNRGNALALAGQLEKAIESYDRALEASPGYEEARFNREVVAKLLEQQENEESSESSDEGQEGEPEDPGEEGENSESGSESQSEENADSSESSEKPSSAEDAPGDEDQRASEAEQKDEESEENEKAGQAEAQEESTDASEPNEDEQAAQMNPVQPESLSDQSEQWLRNIPDDPGGLMRRKFQYQAESRRQRGGRPRSETRY